jgi:hypothetical protein
MKMQDWDPDNPPEPTDAAVERLMRIFGAMTVGSGVVVAGMIMTVVTPMRTMGATSSSKIEWQERQSEIQDAIAAEEQIGEERGSRAEPEEDRLGE